MSVKRVAAFAAALALLFAAFSFCVFAEDEELPTGAGRAEVKIAELVEVLAGKYFTTTGKSCGNSKCDKCLNTNVITSDWFVDLFGYGVAKKQLLGHYFPDGTQSMPSGYSCYGFAVFAMWYMFAPSDAEAIPSVARVKVAGTARFDCKTLSENALPGDVVRIAGKSGLGHSVVYVSCDESGVTVLDANYEANNLVSLHKIPYTARYGSQPISMCSVAITRAGNYDTVTGGTDNRVISEATAESAIEFENIKTPTVHVVGKSYLLSGKIVSAVRIAEATCRVVDAVTGDTVSEQSVAPNAFSLDISSSDLNKLTKFGSLAEGAYVLVYEATDKNGYTASYSSLAFGVAPKGHVCEHGITEVFGDGTALFTCFACGAQMIAAYEGEDDQQEPDAPPEPEPVPTEGEEPAADLDGDGYVTSDDAVYLLYHVFFTESYPVGTDCDYDRDGYVTSDDAVYLLYHVFFGEDYPITNC